MVRVEVWFDREGGRAEPPYGDSYRPHLVVDGGEYLGVEFVHLDKAPLGTPLQSCLRLPYNIDYSPLRPGACFVVMEGFRRVGEGVVLPTEQATGAADPNHM